MDYSWSFHFNFTVPLNKIFHQTLVTTSYISWSTV